MSMQTTSYLYRPIVKRSWQIAKANPSLWLFGLFAIFVSSGGELEILLRALYNQQSSGIIEAFVTSFSQGWAEGSQMANAGFWLNSWSFLLNNFGSAISVVAFLVAVLLVSIFFVWLTISSQIALIKNISLINKNKKSSLKEGFEFSLDNFWPVFVIVVVLRLVIITLLAFLGWELWLLASAGLWGKALYALSFLLFVGGVLLLSFLLKYQIFYVLLKKQKLAVAFKSGWQLFLKNWLISLEMALLMFIAYLAATILSTLAMTILTAVPVVVIPYYFDSLPFILKVTVSFLAFVAMIATVLFISAYLATWQWTAWTLLFEKLAGGGEEQSKLVRLKENLGQLPQTLFGKS